MLAITLLGSAGLYCDSTSTQQGPLDAVWPPAPNAPSTPGTASVVYALDSLSFGDEVGGTGWERHGFDLDGKITGKASTDVCTLAPNAGASVQADGTHDGLQGVDNSFGSNIFPIIQNATGEVTPSADLARFMREGIFTLQLEVIGRDLTNPSQTNVGLAMESFPSSWFDPVMGTSPKLLPSEDWPVRSDVVQDPHAAPLRSREAFPGAYVSSGTFVSGNAFLTLPFMIGRIPLDLRIHDAIVVMSVTGASGDSVQGTLAGVLDAAEVTAAFKIVAGNISPSLCAGSTFDGIAEQIGQAVDIMIDGSNQPGVPCNGISIGVGFTGKRIGNPTRVEPPVVTPDPCGEGPDAGPDATPDAAPPPVCQTPGDCVDAGDASAMACCESFVIGPSCSVDAINAACEARAACSTSILASCGTTTTVRGCASQTDCDEATYPKCCQFPGASTNPYVCVSTFIAAAAKCK